MADYESLVSLNRGTAAMLQAVNQFSIGSISGFLLDWLFMHWKTDTSNIFIRASKILLQTAANGYILSYLLPWIHPSQSGYRDPTGGYMLAIGLINSQPNYTRSTKEILSAFLELYDEIFLMNNTSKNINSTLEDQTELSDEEE